MSGAAPRSEPGPDEREPLEAPEKSAHARGRVVLVTGGTGTLGRRVVRQLRQVGHEVRVLSHSGAPGTLPGDLASGAGVAAAVDGAEVVVHCASRPTRPKDVDVEGTRRLVDAAAGAGVADLIYPSIVGIERNQSFGLYRAKLAAEELIEAGPVPWTIQRATQFHELVLALLRALDRLPLVLPVPRGTMLQPVASAEVAARIVTLVGTAPAGRATELGGPQVRALESLAQAHLDHVGHDKRVVGIPLPGAAARAFRAGAQVSEDGDVGRITWEEHLAGRRA